TLILDLLQQDEETHAIIALVPPDS
ncbi:hypothetical protein A2U01_0075989, partial [Trifolium medium]|nr:hypothetical protein [Trifolium medium]